MLQELPEVVRMVLGRHSFNLFPLDGKRLPRITHACVEGRYNRLTNIRADQPCRNINFRASQLRLTLHPEPVRIHERLQCVGIQTPEGFVWNPDGQRKWEEIFVDNLGECS